MFGGGGAAFTLITTVSASVAPLLSVTRRRKVYVPSTRLVMLVNEAAASAITNCEGPLSFAHA